jgi:hypothetical protein
MRILALYNGEYGIRHIDNIRQQMPADWTMETWQAPNFLPPVVDYPEDYLPDAFAEHDLLLSFAEVKGVAELLPDIAQMTRAQAVIAAVDNEAWLPRGLAAQLREWLARMGVACATPKPLCSLTERDYAMTRRQRKVYESELISAFAAYFGQPKLSLTIDPDSRIITSAQVTRDTVCGCAGFVCKELLGVSADDAEEKAGLAHHHYPCLASMGIDSDYSDTLMHVSGNIMKDQVSEQVKPYKKVHYISPGKKSD